MITKMLLITAASIFVTFMAVTSEEKEQQIWLVVGVLLMIMFGAL